MKPTETQLKGIENILKIIQTLSHDTDTQPLKELVFIIINEDLSNIKKDAVNLVLDKFENNIITFEETMLIIHAIIEKDDISLTNPYTPPPTPIQPSIPYIPWAPNPDISPNIPYTPTPTHPDYPWITYFSKADSTSTTGNDRPDIYAYNNRSITN